MVIKPDFVACEQLFLDGQPAHLQSDQSHTTKFQYVHLSVKLALSCLSTRLQIMNTLRYHQAQNEKQLKFDHSDVSTAYLFWLDSPFCIRLETTKLTHVIRSIFKYYFTSL